MARCPRCFSQISGFATGEEAEWTDDPIRTPKGEAGEAYKGFIYFNPTHIEEIQQIRQQQEEDLGFIDPASTGYVEGEDTPKTTFTPVRIEGQKVYFYKKHLRELRESTEKILEATGQTKDSYFNYDEEETEYNIGSHQLDWHDVDLTQKFLDIKAVHIEDLRHYLFIGGWIENWSDSPVGDYGIDFTLQGGELQGNQGKIWKFETISPYPPSGIGIQELSIVEDPEKGKYYKVHLYTGIGEFAILRCFSIEDGIILNNLDPYISLKSYDINVTNGLQIWLRIYISMQDPYQPGFTLQYLCRPDYSWGLLYQTTSTFQLNLAPTDWINFRRRLQDDVNNYIIGSRNFTLGSKFKVYRVNIDCSGGSGLYSASLDWSVDNIRIG